MATLTRQTSVRKNSPRASLVIENLRSRIQTMPAGVPLPSIAEIMDELSVSRGTIDSAYDVLEAGGYVQRKHGKGVFVSDRTATGELAILVKPSLLNSVAHPFYSLAISTLLEKIGGLKGQYQAKLHCGDVTYTGEDWPASLDVLNAPVRARLRGIFSFNPLYELTEQLEKAEIPLVSLVLRAGSRYTVGFAKRNTLRDALAHLKAAGCKTAGVIWEPGPKRKQKLYENKCRNFVEVAAGAGLETKESWMLGFPTEGSYAEKIGYNLFVNLWNQNERPDGLFVEDDILCRGVLRGILHLGVKVPEQLQLITETTSGIELSYHESVTRIEYDADELAEAAVGMMYKLVQGQEPEKSKVILPGEFIQGQTTQARMGVPAECGS